MATSHNAQTKLDLIEWIAALDRPDWLEQLWQLKQTLDATEAGPSHPPQGRVMRGYGKYAGKIWMSEDFDEPLEDFKDYM